MNKLCSLDQALSLIKNCDTVNIVASGGGFQDADLIYRGIEKSFWKRVSPITSRFVHITGVGSGNETGRRPVRPQRSGQKGHRRPLALVKGNGPNGDG